MEIDRSDSIRISLVRLEGQPFTPIIEAPKRTVTVATAIPVEPPQIPGYRAYVTAKLVGTAFKIEPVSVERQSLEQSRLTWEWNIMPIHPGRQTLNASIVIQWEPVRNGGETIQHQMWRSRFDILVAEPLVTTGQLNVFAMISAFLGSGLSIPWVYERIKERRQKRPVSKAGVQEEESLSLEPPDEVASLRRQLAQRRANLQKLEEQATIYEAGAIPLHLLNQIEAEKQAIAELMAQLSRGRRHGA